MSKLLTVILCLVLCVSSAAEEADTDSFLLRIWDESGLEISYLRFDVYIEDDYTGLVCSCPDDGEDFYRFPFDVSDADELNGIKVEVSYGISALTPEEAILQVMMGNPAEEHHLLILDLVPEEGRVYDMALVSDEDGSWRLVDIYHE